MNNSNPLVSILVPTYNRRWLLPRTLQSLVNQSYENLEIILVNDAGEDVGDIVAQFNDNRIKYFQNKNNLNLAGTRNVALKNSNGEVISLLDDDDIYLKYTVELRVQMMNKLNAEIVYTRSLQDIWERTKEGYQSIHKQLYWPLMDFSRDMLLVQNIAPCCNVCFSRKAWDDSGNYWFNTDLTTTEDHDFWIALSRKTDFKNLEYIDTECSFKKDDPNQMTGQLNFVPNWIKVFKNWRHTAEDIKWVTDTQNAILIQSHIDPSQYGL